MFRKKKKTKRDLLKMSAVERNKFTREIRRELQLKAVESKLQQILLDTENLTVDGKVVLDENQPLEGITVRRKDTKCHFYYFT